MAPKGRAGTVLDLAVVQRMIARSARNSRNNRLSKKPSFLLAFSGICALVTGTTPPAIAMEHFFPSRPRNAKLEQMVGVLTDYGIGNDSGSLTVKDDAGKSHEFYVGGPPFIDGKSYDCYQPPAEGFRSSIENCREWPATIRFGQTRVKVVYWRTLMPNLDTQGRRYSSTPVLATDELHTVASGARATAAVRPSACSFRTEDHHPPTAVRDGPSEAAKQVGSVPNHTGVAIIDGRDGWLRLAGARPRWIALNLTRFICPSGQDAPEARLDGVEELERRGEQGVQPAVVQLVTAMTTPSLDGEAAEGAEDALLKLMALKPDAVIHAVQILKPGAARSLLTDLAGQKAFPTAFTQALRRPENRNSIAAQVVATLGQSQR